MYFPLSGMSDATLLASRPSYMNYLWATVALIGEKQKYYFAWKVAEAASVAAGFGFEGFDEKTGRSKGYGGVANVDVLRFETATNIQTISRNWNKRTQGWLERYSFNRLANRSLMILYFVSALWHGLYPGYFVFFMTAALITPAERRMAAALKPLLCPEYDPRSQPGGACLSDLPAQGGNVVYWVFSCLFTHGAMNILVQPFSQRTMAQSLLVMNEYVWAPVWVYFFGGYILAPLLTMLFDVGSKEEGKKKKKKMA